MHRFMLISTGYGVGLTSSCLGLIRVLQRQGLKVGYFKPIAQNAQSIELICHTHQVRSPTPLSLTEVEAYLADNQLDDLLERLVSLEAQAAQDVDVLIIEGLVPSQEIAYAARLNAKLARSLDASAILVASAKPLSHNFFERIEIQARLLEGVEVAGVIVNKQTGKPLSTLGDSGLMLLGQIPWEPTLNAPRTEDIAAQLNLDIHNPGDIAQRRVHELVLAASSAESLARSLRPGALVVVPADRADAIFSTCLASMNGMPLAGLLICDAAENITLSELCQPALTQGLPVLTSRQTASDLVMGFAELNHPIMADDTQRAEAVSDFVADHLHLEPLMARLGHIRQKRLSPAAFRYQLVERAKAANKRIVLPEGDEPRTVAAAVICHSRGIARCVLLAPPEKVQAVALAQGLTLPETLEIIDPERVRERYVAPMVERRKAKGLNEPMARAQLEDTVVLGTMMLALDEVDGLVSGAVHTTANTIRPALQLIKTAPGFNLVSSVFFMLLPDQVLVYGDCAVNPDPNAAELAEIALQSAESAKAFGIEPKVAMISYSTGHSGEGADVAKVHEASLIAKEKAPTLLIDGPLQYDAASVLSVGQQKAPHSLVAGQATVFVFPDLNTGNTTYKAVQRSANCISVGPMLQGLNKPVNDLSRGALVDDIVFTIALTAIQADSRKTD